jgi:superoxide dismutase
MSKSRASRSQTSSQTIETIRAYRKGRNVAKNNRKKRSKELVKQQKKIMERVMKQHVNITSLLQELNSKVVVFRKAQTSQKERNERTDDALETVKHTLEAFDKLQKKVQKMQVKADGRGWLVL